MNADKLDSLTQRVLGANECEPSDCGSFFSPGPPRGTLPLPPCQDLVNWLVVREHPPFHNLAVANYRLPSRRRPPRNTIYRPACLPPCQHCAPSRHHMLCLYPVVRAHREITTPSHLHGGCAAHPIPHRVYK